MLLTNDELPWTSEDVVNLRNFLTTVTGSRLLPRVLNEAPTLLGKGDVNEILIRSGEVRGFQAAAREFFNLAYPPKQENREVPTYPPLNDDTAWNDGQKLTQTDTK